MTLDMNKPCLHWIGIIFKFHSKSSYLRVNVHNLSLLILAIPSWVIWRMYHISFAVSQFETHKNSVRPNAVVVIVFSFKLHCIFFYYMGSNKLLVHGMRSWLKILSILDLILANVITPSSFTMTKVSPYMLWYMVIIF